MSKIVFHRVWILSLLFVCWGFLPSGQAAELKTEDQATAGEDQDAVKIEDVVVRGEVVTKDLDATSATVLNNAQITNRILITPLDIVSLAPGISVHQYKQGGTASNFIMRGFSGNSHGANTAVFLDGIPLNEGDGYADTNIINPEEIERVEIVKGPASALYGNYASAGSIAYYTLKQVDHNQLKLHYGAHNTYEANFVGGSSDEQWDQVYAVQTYHTDGYQANSDWDRQNISARITRHLTDDMNVRMSLQGFNSDWDAPGYISQAQFDADPTQAVSETNGGGKNRTAGRVDLDYRINAESKALVYVWKYDQEFWRWYSQGTQGDNLRNFRRDVYGAGASYNFIGEFFSREMHLTLGADYMVEDIDRERWYLNANTGREKGDKFWDYQIDMQTLAFYTEGGYQILPPLKIIVGARYDTFSGDLVDHLDNDTEFSMADQSIFSPKAGAIWSALQGRMEIFANYGRGFAMLPGFSEKAAFEQENWDPQERTQYEAGFRLRPNGWFNGEIVAYRLETEKDFIYDRMADEYENVGETTREGIEVQVEFSAFDYGYLRADYAYADARNDQCVVDGVDYQGKTLKGVPENIYNAEIGYDPPLGWGGRLSYHCEDGYYLDDENLHTSKGWDRVDAQLTYRFGEKNQYLAALDVVNLLDEKYADYTGGSYDTNRNFNKTYSPALPLSIYMTFKMDF